MELFEIVKKAVGALEDKKAEDITVIDISEVSTIAEYFIIATATSQHHIKALAEEVEEKLEEAGFVADHIEGKATGWLLLEYMGVVIHIFSAEANADCNALNCSARL